MKLTADLHMHTLVSHHAYSTMQEMCAYATGSGLETIAVTDHAPGMPDAASDWHFGSMFIVPRRILGVNLLRGAELNVKDYDGTVDLDEKTLEFLDIVIASLHTYAIKPASQADHDRVYAILCENRHVDIIGHPVDQGFTFDYDALARNAAVAGVAVELNSHALKKSPDSLVNYRRLAEACLKYGTFISVASDAHIAFEIADFGPVPGMLDEIGFPPAQVINSSREALSAFLRQRGSEAAETLG